MSPNTSIDYSSLFRHIKTTSWVAFSIFIIVFTKDILVSGFEIIPERSLLNRQISWLFILPISVIGTGLATLAIRRAILDRKKKGIWAVNINLVLTVPILLYVFFCFVILMSIWKRFFQKSRRHNEPKVKKATCFQGLIIKLYETNWTSSEVVCNIKAYDIEGKPFYAVVGVLPGLLC